RWSLTGMLAQAAWIEIAAEQFDSAETLSRDALRTGIETDDVGQLSEALLYLAVLAFEQTDYRRARELVAATGWYIHPARNLESHPTSTIARALDLRRPILTNRYEGAARDGRTRGVLATARAIVAT